MEFVYMKFEKYLVVIFYLYKFSEREHECPEFKLQ